MRRYLVWRGKKKHNVLLKKRRQDDTFDTKVIFIILTFLSVDVF